MMLLIRSYPFFPHNEKILANFLGPSIEVNPTTMEPRDIKDIFRYKCLPYFNFAW